MSEPLTFTNDGIEVNIVYSDSPLVTNSKQSGVLFMWVNGLPDNCELIDEGEKVHINKEYYLAHPNHNALMYILPRDIWYYDEWNPNTNYPVVVKNYLELEFLD